MTSSADVATRAGVSRSTVSQILNGRGHLFTDETVALVRQTAEVMGYRPSVAGRTLARGKSDIVITLIPDITFGATVREFVDLLTEGLAKAGLTNLLRLASSESTLQDAILGLRPHAIFALAPLADSEASRLREQGVRVIGGSQLALAAADTEIGRLQVEHLKSQGYKVIVPVRPLDKRERLTAPQREAAVIEAGLRNNLEVLPTIEFGMTSSEAVEAVNALPPGKIGLACYNDEVALAMLGAAIHLGRQVPGEVGVIGVDNSVVARASTPTITSINIDLEMNVRDLVSHILSGEALDIPAGTMDDYLSGYEVIPGGTTGT